MYICNYVYIYIYIHIGVRREGEVDAGLLGLHLGE